MRPLFAFRRFFRSLAADQRGSALPLIGLGVLAMVGATGTAVDMGRAQLVQAKLSSALDTAGLAAGASATSADPQTEVNKYMAANFPAGYLGSSLNAATVTPNSDNTVLTLTATATVPMTFMKVFGKDSITVRADSEITRTNRGMELVMVLDITGSMWTDNNYLKLRDAGTSLINTLYGNKSTVDNLWVGIVPYVTAVNLSSQSKAQSWLTSYDLTKYPSNWPSGQTKWKGCMEERASPLDTAEDAPVAGSGSTALASRFPMFFWADTAASGDNNWINDSTHVVQLYDTVNYTSGNPGGAQEGKSPNISCGDAVMAMTSNKQTILNKIGGLVPYRKSGTMTNVGLVWGWRMLSPLWRGQWDHELINNQVKLPLDYNTPLMDKVVIIETDGINNINSNSVNPYSEYTPYGRINRTSAGGRPDINTTGTATGITIMNNKMSTVCSAMKAKGIIIYTVTFGLGNSSDENNARTLFRGCATKPEYYFDANSDVPGAPQVDLSTAFKQIGDSLANLRISK